MKGGWVHFSQFQSELLFAFPWPRHTKPLAVSLCFCSTPLCFALMFSETLLSMPTYVTLRIAPLYAGCLRFSVPLSSTHPASTYHIHLEQWKPHRWDPDLSSPKIIWNEALSTRGSHTDISPLSWEKDGTCNVILGEDMDLKVPAKSFGAMAQLRPKDWEQNRRETESSKNKGYPHKGLVTESKPLQAERDPEHHRDVPSPRQGLPLKFIRMSHVTEHSTRRIFKQMRTMENSGGLLKSWKIKMTWISGQRERPWSNYGSSADCSFDLEQPFLLSSRQCHHLKMRRRVTAWKVLSSGPLTLTLSLTFPSCMALGISLNLLKPHFHHLQNERALVWLTLQKCCRERIRKGLHLV